MGRAGTAAVVTGLEIYGPHAIGFVLFAFPAAGIAGLVYALFGVKVAATVVGVFLSLGFGAVHRHGRREKRLRTKERGHK
jgi:hypothetical protein